MRQATAMLHGGQQRSSFRETSEAIYMTQGFVYDSAEAAEARFLGTNSGYMYTRYANPNSDSLERKMCLL